MNKLLRALEELTAAPEQSMLFPTNIDGCLVTHAKANLNDFSPDYFRQTKKNKKAETNNNQLDIDLILQVKKEDTSPTNGNNYNWDIDDKKLIAIREHLIMDAMRVVGSPKAGKKLKQEAMDWIFDEQDERPFSFNVCCLECGYDPDEMRDTFQSFVNRENLLRGKGS